MVSLPAQRTAQHLPFARTLPNSYFLERRTQMMGREKKGTDKSSSSFPASLTNSLILSTLVSGPDFRVAAKIL